MLQFNSLVLIPTNICNLTCRHCYPTSGPSRGDAVRYGAEKMLAPERAERYIRQIPELDCVGKTLHFGGGESTLFRKEFLAILEIGKSYGLAGSVTTNCSWAKDQDKADEFIETASRAGLRRIEISLSVFHQEFLDIEFPLRAIRAAKSLGLKICLRPIVTRSASIAATLKGLPDKDLEGVAISVSKCLPVGRALSEIPHDEFLFEPLSYGGCHNILNLTIRQDGSVFPCCAGSDVTRSLRLGDANKEPLADIIARANLDPLLIALTQQGPRYLAELLRESGGRDFLKDEHVGICHLCNALFIDDSTASQVRQALLGALAA